MESYAPILGMVLVSIGSVMVLAGAAGLVYSLRLRSRN